MIAPRSHTFDCGQPP